MTQRNFKNYFIKKYNLDTKLLYKIPDQVFIKRIKNIFYINILEIKNQNVNGSVEEKLDSCIFVIKRYNNMFKRIEKILNNNYNYNYKFKIIYGYCVNNFLKNKITSNCYKYNDFRDICNEYNINILYGEDSNYFDKLYNWIK